MNPMCHKFFSRYHLEPYKVLLASGRSYLPSDHIPFDSEISFTRLRSSHNFFYWTFFFKILFSHHPILLSKHCDRSQHLFKSGGLGYIIIRPLFSMVIYGRIQHYYPSIDPGNHTIKRFRDLSCVFILRTRFQHLNTILFLASLYHNKNKDQIILFLWFFPTLSTIFSLLYFISFSFSSERFFTQIRLLIADSSSITNILDITKYFLNSQF